MRRLLSGLLIALALTRVASAEPKKVDYNREIRPILSDLCYKCHGPDELTRKGKLRLDDVSFALDSVESADRWQKILNQINSGEMPPDDAKQPERGAKAPSIGRSRRSRPPSSSPGPRAPTSR